MAVGGIASVGMGTGGTAPGDMTPEGMGGTAPVGMAPEGTAPGGMALEGMGDTAPVGMGGTAPEVWVALFQ